MGAGWACCSTAAWCLICSYNPQARGQAGPITRVAASSANGRYIGRPGVFRRDPAHLHESRTWWMRQRKGQRQKQRRITAAYGFMRQVRRLDQSVIKNTPFSRRG